MSLTFRHTEPKMILTRLGILLYQSLLIFYDNNDIIDLIIIDMGN